MTNAIGNVELTISINKENLTSQVINAFQDCQQTADKNTITYKIAGDKSNLDSMLKQLKGMTPELLTKLKLDFEKSDYDRQINLLKGTTGKKAKEIGEDFKASIGESLKGFNINDVLGKNLEKSGTLNVKDVGKLKTTLQELMNQTKGFDLSKVTSVSDIEKQAVSLNKINVILDTLNKYSGQKSIKIDGNTFNIAEMLQKNTSQIDSIMNNVGDVIQKNASQWATSLENTFNNEFSGIVSLFNNLKEIIDGTFTGASGSGSGLNNFKGQIAEIETEIQKAEKELEELKKIQDKFAGLKGFRAQSQMDREKKSALDQISNISSKASEINAGKNTGTELEQFKSLIQEYMKFGGVLNDLPQTARNLAESLKIVQIPKLNLDNVAQQITDIETRITELNARKQELSSTPAQAPTQSTTDPTAPKTSGTPTEAVVSPKLSPSFKEDLQTLVDGVGAVSVSVSGKISDTFLSDVQTQADSLDTVKIGVGYKQTEGENVQKIPVNVEVTPKLPDSFKSDLQGLIDQTGKYEVAIGTTGNQTDNYIPVKATVENGEEVKTTLKQAIEGDKGLDVKINPVIDKDVKVEISNAVLKGVQIEGDISGGNLKPASIDSSSSAPATAVETNSNVKTDSIVQEHDKVQAELEETKQKLAEVGNASIESANVQKQSLLEVIKEYERIDAEQKKLMQIQDATHMDGMDAFVQKKKQEAQKYQHIHELITKIQSKMSEKSSKSATQEDFTRHAAGLVAYVERLRELMGSAFSYDVLGENGEAKFKAMQELVDNATSSTSNYTEKIKELGSVLTNLNNEKSSLEQTATASEKLEAELYSLVKSVERLKASNKKGDLLNLNSKTFTSFFDKWKEYKNLGGKLNISDLTTEEKVINSINKAYNTYIENKVKAANEESKTLQAQVNTVKTNLQKQFPNVDLSQYQNVFDDILNKKKSWTDAFAEIRDSIKATQEAATSAKPAMDAVAKAGQEQKAASQAQTKNIKLGTKAEINVVPKVEDPASFAGQITEQIKGNSALVDVKLNAASMTNATGTNVGTTGMAYETQEAEELRKKIVEVTTAVDNKTNAFRLEEQVVVGTTQREISALTELDGQLIIILNDIQRIVDNPLSVKVDYSSIEQLYQADENGVSSIDSLKQSIDGLQTGVLKDLGQAFKDLKLPNDISGKITSLASALDTLKTNLSNIDPNSFGFLDRIKDLAKEATGLKDLATVIRASKEEIQKAKSEINNAGKKSSNVSQTTDKEKYAILKDSLNEILRLTKEYNKEQNLETKNNIAAQIQAYKDRADALQLELYGLEKINEVEQNRIDIIQNKISLEENKQANKELAVVERQIAAEEHLEQVLSDQSFVLSKDSNEWQHALDLLSLYKDELQDVVKITRNINVDKVTGFRATSYQFTDSKGSTKTVGADANLLMDNTKIADLNDLYSKLKASANEYYNLQERILKGDTSVKTEQNSLIAYNNMLQAQKEIAYWKEKGLVPSREQLQIEERILILSQNLKEQEQKTGLLNMYHNIVDTINRLTAKQKEVNELKLKADGTNEFAESIQNAQNNVSTLIATLRGFKFSDFFTSDALASLGLNGSSFLFNNNDLNSLKYVISQLPLTESQINAINDALDKNTLIKEQNVAAQNKINETEQKQVNDQLAKEQAQSAKNQKKTYADFEKEQIQSAANAQKELNSLIDQYIAKRNQTEMTVDPVKRSVYDHEAFALLEQIEQKTKAVGDAGLLTESQIEGALRRVDAAEDELTKKLEVRNNVQKEVNAQKQEEELLSKMAAGREQANAKTQKANKDAQLAQNKAINKSLDEQYEKLDQLAKNSYNRQARFETEKNKLLINNIGKDNATVEANKVQIAYLDELIAKEEQLRQKYALGNRAKEASAELDRKRDELAGSLKAKQDAYNASLAVARKELRHQTTDVLQTKLSNAISSYSNADTSKLAEANELLEKLKTPFNNWDVNASNVNSVIKKIESDTESIISALKQQHEKVAKQTQANSMTGVNSKLLKESFKNISIGDAKFQQVLDVKGDNTATLQFVEDLGNKVRITKVEIQDMNAALADARNATNGKINVDNNPNYKVSTGGEKAKKEISEVELAYKGLIRTEIEYQRLKAKVDTNTAKDKEINRFEELTIERARYNEKIQESIDLNEREKASQAKYSEKQKVGSEQYANYVKGISDNQEKYASQLNNTKQLMNQVFNPNISGFEDIFKRAQTEVDALNKKLIQGQISNVQTGYTDKVNGIVANLKNVVAVASPYNDAEAQQKMMAYAQSINNGNVAVGNFINNNRTLTASFKDQNGMIQEVAISYNQVTGAITATGKGIKQAQTMWTGFTDGLKARMRSLLQYLTIFVSYYRIIGMFKKGISYVREFNTSLTQMNQVSSESISTLKKFQDASFDVANSVGTTAQQIQKSTVDWLRLGESFKQATESAQAATTLLNVSDFESIDEATKSLVSMSAAYGDLTKTDIVDKLSYVGNHYSISTQELAVAMQASASALTTAGNDMDQAAAIITAGNAVVQDASKVGSGVRTIALRITGTKEAKEELEALGESTDDFVIRTASKTQETIKNFTRVASNNYEGFDILDENGNYKSTYDTLLGIAEIYDEIIEADKKYGSNMANGLLETLAGKNRSNIAASILQNKELLESVYESSSAESEGSAQEALDIYLESIEAKIQKFTNEVQEFWHNLINADAIKFVVDAGTKIVDVLGKLTDKFGLAGTAAAAFGAAFGFSALKTTLKSGGRTKKFVLIV